MNMFKNIADAPAIEQPSTGTKLICLENGSVAQLDASESYLQSLGNPLVGKTALYLGDSLCWAERDPKGGWPMRIKNSSMMANAYNRGVGGASVTANAGNRTYISRHIDTVHAEFPTGIDYIITDGGINDEIALGDSTNARFGTMDWTNFSGTYDDTTFTGALDTLLYKMISYYPNAKHGFILTTRTNRNNPAGYDSANNSLRRYYDRIVECCHKWGVPVLDLWQECPYTPKIAAFAGLYADDIHLNEAGYDAVVPKIEAWMKTL